MTGQLTAQMAAMVSLPRRGFVCFQVAGAFMSRNATERCLKIALQSAEA
jgi:hypothetical protein